MKGGIMKTENREIENREIAAGGSNHFQDFRLFAFAGAMFTLAP